MFGSTVLEIAAGLVFTYLITSLICTAMNELIAGGLRSRARNLEIGIRNLLDGTSERLPPATNASTGMPTGIWSQAKNLMANVGNVAGAITPILQANASAGVTATETFAQKFFDHPLIDSLSKQDELPSYIPSKMFATVLMNLVDNQSSVPGKLKTIKALQGGEAFEKLREIVEKLPGEQHRITRVLVTLINNAEADAVVAGTELQELSRRIEQWYDQAMERVSGWYKRKTQMVLVIIAIVVAVLCNIDTIAIWQSLGDESTRASVLSVAEKTVHNEAPQQQYSPGESVSEAYRTIQSSLTRLETPGIPVGWHWNNTDSTDNRADNLHHLLHRPADILLKLVGILLTATAASLGAPFWFDILAKVMAIRSTGASPAPLTTAKKPS